MMLEEDVSDGEEEENWTDTWTDESAVPCHETGASMILKRFSGDNVAGTLKSKPQDTLRDAELMSRMVLNDNKAGMEGLDKTKINQIILEASKGSKYFENEKKKEEQVNRRIEEQMIKMKKISEQELRQGQEEADRLLEEFERQRDLTYTIVHIDMDAFYAAVEMRDDPSLRNKPMAVGGISMLSTSNYLARKYGVRAAMPGFIGKKLCPDLVLVKENFEKYTSVSKDIRGVFADYDPNFCPMSLDEAYLDFTDHVTKRSNFEVADRTFLCRHSDTFDEASHCLCDLNLTIREKILTDINFQDQDVCENNVKQTVSQSKDSSGSFRIDLEKSLKVYDGVCPKCHRPLPPFEVVTFGVTPEEAVKELRSRIQQRTRLTASAGIAPNMMLAKVCSDKNKPNGQYRILPALKDVMEFIRDLPTRKISGIGKVSEKMLNAVGVHTCTHLYQQRALLYHLYSSISFNYFMRICLGIGSVTVERDSERKSISTERTFNELSRPADLYSKCMELCESLCEDLKDEQLKGKTVSIKLKTVKFEVMTRAHTLPNYTSDVEVIFSAAKELLRTEIAVMSPNPLKLRLMGVRMSTLLHESLCRKEQQNKLTRYIMKGRTSDENEQVKDVPKHTDIVDGSPHLPTLPGISTENEAGEITTVPLQYGLLSTNQQPHHFKSEENCVNDQMPKQNGLLLDNEDLHHFKREEQHGNRNKIKELPLHGNLFNGKDHDSGKNNGEKCEERNEKESSGSYESAGKLERSQVSAKSCPDVIGMVSNMEESSSCDKIESNLHGIEGEHISVVGSAVGESEGCDIGESSTTTEESLKLNICPVCHDSVKCESLSQFNQHIDVCLNRQIVKDCSRYQPKDDKPKSNKARVKGHNSSPNSMKLKSPSISKSLKRTKLEVSKSPAGGSKGKTSEKTVNTIGIGTPKHMLKYDENSNKTDAIADSQIPHEVDFSRDVSLETTPRVPDHGSLVCPVCFMEQTGSDLEGFNSHVDTCLSKGTITEILKEQKGKDQSSDQPPLKRKRFNSGMKTKSIQSFFKS